MSNQKELMAHFGHSDTSAYECEFCRFVTTELFLASGLESCPRALCILCYSTDSGIQSLHNNKYNEATEAILKTICFVGNHVIAEIRRSTKEPQ